MIAWKYKSIKKDDEEILSSLSTVNVENNFIIDTIKCGYIIDNDSLIIKYAINNSFPIIPGFAVMEDETERKIVRNENTFLFINRRGHIVSANAGKENQGFKNMNNILSAMIFKEQTIDNEDSRKDQISLFWFW